MERVILNSCKAIYEKQMDAYYSVTWRKKWVLEHSSKYG